MSLRVMLWALEEPRAADLASSALRVFLVLADHAHDDGRNAWAGASRTAARLGLSERTVERAIATLRERALIVRGDQAAVAGYRADRRPVVWDLAYASERADTLVGPKTHGPTRSRSRADTNGDNGPTPGVGQTKNSPIRNHAGASVREAPPNPDAGDVGLCPRCARQHDAEEGCARSSMRAPSDLRARIEVYRPERPATPMALTATTPGAPE